MGRGYRGGETSAVLWEPVHRGGPGGGGPHPRRPVPLRLSDVGRGARDVFDATARASLRGVEKATTRESDRMDEDGVVFVSFGRE